MLVYVKGEGCQEQNQASQRDTTVARAGWWGGQSTHVHVEREPLILWEILVALGVGEFFLGQD